MFQGDYRDCAFDLCVNVLFVFFSEGKGTSWEVTKEVGVSLCEAMIAFDKVLSHISTFMVIDR